MLRFHNTIEYGVTVRSAIWALCIVGATVLIALPRLAPAQTIHYCATRHTPYPNSPCCPISWFRLTLDHGHRLATPHPTPRATKSVRTADKIEQQRQARFDWWRRNRVVEVRRTKRTRAEKERRGKLYREQKQEQRRYAAQQVERKAADMAAGFKYMSIEDLLLDYRGMADEVKVIVTGLYFQLGQIGALSPAIDNLHQVYVDTAGLSRDARRFILECTGRNIFCEMTIWAHTGCNNTAVFSHFTEAPCIVAEGINSGAYDRLIGDELK